MTDDELREIAEAAIQVLHDAHFNPGTIEVDDLDDAVQQAAANTRSTILALLDRLAALEAERAADKARALEAIAEMMGEFVDNWPQPKRVGTALKLIAKTMRAALEPPKHVYWGAGEPDCPPDIKAGNGELHTLRCKVCGNEDASDTRCRTALERTGT